MLELGLLLAACGVMLVILALILAAMPFLLLYLFLTNPASGYELLSLLGCVGVPITFTGLCIYFHNK